MYYGTRRFRRQPRRRVPFQQQPSFRFRFFIIPLRRRFFLRQFPSQRFIQQQLSKFFAQRVYEQQPKTGAACIKAVSAETALPYIVFITQASTSAAEACSTSSPASAASQGFCTASCCNACGYPCYR